jgi:hypothetical protein
VLAAIDGFYAQVVQQLRPWSIRALQLPKGARTAAEEAGIDITPPPGDVLQARGESVPEPGDETQPAKIAEDFAELATEPGPAQSDPASSTEPELVSWDTAQVKLDRERELGEAPADER